MLALLDLFGYIFFCLQFLEFTFQKENFKHLGNDYVKWSSKLTELEHLMKVMLTQINEKRISASRNDENEKVIGLKETIKLVLN